MKIEIEENEIKEAILDYVAKQGFSVDPLIAEVDIKNARGEFGVTATISVIRTEPTPAELKKVVSIDTDKPKAVSEDKGKDKEEEDKAEPAANKPLFN